MLRPYEGVSARIAVLREKLGDEGAADAIGALLGALRPYGLKADSHGRQNGHMQDREEIVRELFGGVHLDRNATESQVHHASAARVVFTEHGVGVCAGHGDALGLALHGVDARRGGRGG